MVEEISVEGKGFRRGAPREKQIQSGDVHADARASEAGPEVS